MIELLIASIFLLAPAQGTQIPCSGGEVRPTKLCFDLYPKVLEVTFDPARVQAASVRRWMKLSQDMASENYYLVPETLEQCVKEDRRYHSCGERADSLDFSNAEVSLQRIRNRIQELDPKHYPRELAEVVVYLKRVQVFFLWRESQRLAYLRNGNVSVLESRFEDLDPKRACGQVIDQIRGSTNKEDAAKLARGEWANCVWFAQRERLGPYPKHAWQSFLSTYGIQEHIRWREVD